MRQRSRPELPKQQNVLYCIEFNEIVGVCIDFGLWLALATSAGNEMSNSSVGTASC